jgi:hypothetical protein
MYAASCIVGKSEQRSKSFEVVKQLNKGLKGRIE